jgi:prevent-host-death family protein
MDMMNNTRGVADAKQRLPALVREAQQGRPTLITNNGKPSALLMPVDELTAAHARKLLAPPSQPETDP